MGDLRFMLACIAILGLLALYKIDSSPIAKLMMTLLIVMLLFPMLHLMFGVFDILWNIYIGN